MSRTKYSEYSATPGDNTDIDGINIGEGMAPSDVNNSLRAFLSQTREFIDGSSGDTLTSAKIVVTTAEILSGVNVTGTATFNSAVIMSSSVTGSALSLSGALTVGGAAILSSTLGVTGTASMGVIDATTLEVTNIKAKDGTASATIADSTGVMTVASAVLTTADINGGTLDNVVVGGATPAAGTFTTATATTGSITTVNATTVNATTVDATNVEATNVKAKDGTAAITIADSTGVVTVASAVLTTADINGGTVDNTAIGAGTPSTGAFTTLSSNSTTTLNGTTIPASKTLLVSTDIGTTVQAYDVDTAKYDDVTANFTGTLQNGGSNVVVDTDIGSTVLAYDSNLQSFVNVFTLPTGDGSANQVLKTDGSGNIGFATLAGTGTVTSVDVSGGTTGLTTSGGPITGSGTITLAGTLAVANGGTGQTTFADGELLIGKTDGSLAKATLTAGSNITITNGDGAITIASSAAAQEVLTPTNVSPADEATGILDTPTLTGSTYYSLYGKTQKSSQWQIDETSDFTSSPLTYDSGEVVAVGVTHAVPSGNLEVSTTYYWRVRYRDADDTWSEWSTPTEFATASEFNNFIATPTATPSIGGALEGGFYTGLIWNQVTQSATSTTIGTGSKTFTVTDAAPLFYSGQAVEIRSRANPATNRMIGTVTGSSGTSLTVNVTSVDGSGTLTDWSVMAKYRVIVAPKSSGENSSKQYKNSNDGTIAAAGTLTEGLKATLALVADGNSTVYPAAHFCNDLTIGGYSDWYLPARDELELIWRNLKPVTDNNYTTTNRPTGATPDYKNLGSLGDTANTHGLNNNSDPQGVAYTSGSPAQTSVSAFQTGNAEAMTFGSNYYWSSTEYSTAGAWFQNYLTSYPGRQNSANKSSSFYARAVRRSII